MIWEKFEETKNEYPEEIVKEAIKGFSDATDKRVEMVVNKLSFTKAQFNFKSLVGEFYFELNLSSPYVNICEISIMKFCYDASMSSVVCIIHQEILDEIKSKLFSDGIEEYNKNFICSPKIFNNLLEIIFESKKFNSIVSGLIKISNKKSFK